MKDRYLICAFHGGKELHFTGVSFSDRGRSKKFANESQARGALQNIRLKFGGVLRRATLYVRPIAGVNVAHLKRNPARSRGSGYRSALDSYARELDEADERLAGFSGRSGKTILKVHAPQIRAGLVIGKLEGVMYATTRDGTRERYLHRFSKNSQPLLIASHDGKQIGIVGGQYRFTDAGIEDE